MALFTPAWKGNDEKKALAQVQKFYENKQMKELFQVAKEAPAEHVRIAAANWLIRCVSDCRNWCSKYRNDPQYRSSVKKSETDARQGEEFLRLLLEQGDEAVRAEAIIELSNHYMLGDYIIPAVNRLNRQDSMDKILLRGNFSVQKAVIDQIDDPETIDHLFKNHPSEAVRMLAAEKRGDENSIVKIAVESHDSILAAEAFHRLSQESSFAYIALNSKNFQMRNDALERLTSPDTIADVTAHAKDQHTRKKALERLNDQHSLLRAALRSEYYDTACDTMDRLEDQELLERIVYEAEQEHIRHAAVGKLKDPKILRKLALDLKDVYGRKEAAAGIDNDEDLFYVIQQSPHEDTRRDAYEQMKEKGFLDKKTIAALQKEIHDPVILEDLEMMRMEQNLRRRIRDTETEELISRLLDMKFSPLQLKGNGALRYKVRQDIRNLGKHLNRNTVEALTLFLYRCRDYDVAKEIFDIMQRCYKDPALDNRLFAKMRLSRFDQFPHIDHLSGCGINNTVHTDKMEPPVIFRF